MYKVINPATAQVLEEFPTATDDEVRLAIINADVAQRSWRALPVAERAAVIARAGKLFKENAEQLSEAVTTEMGKRYQESLGEMGVVGDIFDYYADNAEALLADETLHIRGGEARIQKRPVGVVLGIMPWNYPVYQVARFAVPNLVLGNGVILKHAPSCPRTAAMIEKLFHDAGVPRDLYINMYLSNEQVEWILADPRIQGVSVTGSERAGAAVAAAAGRNLKKVVLELGGSDPMIILDSDNLDATVNTAVESRMGNTGQACNAPKRMIVMSDIYDEFVRKLSSRIAELRAGDPMDPETSLAPLSSTEAADRLLAQIESAKAQGANVVLGGNRIERPGAYVQPALITDVTPEMDVHHQELFGPVAVVYRVESDDEAVDLANDTPFGLGASVFSTDHSRARRVAEGVEAGMVYINAPGGTQADLPFGGIKRSGIGRELGALGIEEFMNKKVIKL